MLPSPTRATQKRAYRWTVTDGPSQKETQACSSKRKKEAKKRRKRKDATPREKKETKRRLVLSLCTVYTVEIRVNKGEQTAQRHLFVYTEAS